MQRSMPLVKKTGEVAAYLLRVVFGTSLIASVVLAWMCIAAIQSSSRDDRDRGSSQRMGRGVVDLTDLLWYW